MEILLYNELDPKKIPSFDKIKRFLAADDFKSADVKKIGPNLYRSKLDRSNRLLFSIYRYHNKAYALILEYIKNHAYEKSRFINRNTVIDEDLIPSLNGLNDIPNESLIYVNPKSNVFNLLDKVISFDDSQKEVYSLQPPLIVIGSAGSGKTVLTLEKLKTAVGDVLYVTRSPYLVKNSRDLYYSLGYENEEQRIDFLSFQEFLESIQIPEGSEVSFADFDKWFSRHRQACRIKDSHQLFEEFRGVITGPFTESAWLSQEDYLGLGVRQSIFPEESRAEVYGIFEKYLEFLSNHQLYDANIISFDYLSRIRPNYDFAVIDEVQDLTNIQLYLILKSLHKISQFVICGDSNQIVHPNFFSWSKTKTFFFQNYDESKSSRQPRELIRVLNSNYRNSPQVTELANRILKIKNARFGSIDKESNYLVKSVGHNQGHVYFLQESDKIKRELDQKTGLSTHFAVIVMYPEQKKIARQFFRTPLIFSIQEAKGLEYENIILFNFLSSDEKRFREISNGVDHDDLEVDLHYARTRDKTDKSLEIYKFYINSLYVAITRAINNLYIIESLPKQRFLHLLGLEKAQDNLELESQDSNLKEWRQEANKLELQGKKQQAEEIRSQILKQKSVEWDVLTGETLENVRKKAIEEGHKKSKLELFEYALVYQDQVLMNELIEIGFGPANNPAKGIDLLDRKYFMFYKSKNLSTAVRQVEKYGVNFRNKFNQTLLMIASRLGNDELIRGLWELGADPELINNSGLNAFQIALEQACSEPKFAEKNLGKIYHLLKPDSISIKVDEQLIKLDNHLMEFLMLNLMIGMFYQYLPQNLIFTHGAFKAQDFVEVLSFFPESVLAERRKKRTYISSILSKNEIHRIDKYNRKLFYRVKRGHYIINPGLSIRVAGEWQKIYDLLRVDMLAYKRQEKKEGWPVFDFGDYSQISLDRFKTYIKQLASGEKVDFLDSIMPF